MSGFSRTKQTKDETQPSSGWHFSAEAAKTFVRQCIEEKGRDSNLVKENMAKSVASR
jgi:hypothetical protein